MSFLCEGRHCNHSDYHSVSLYAAEDFDRGGAVVLKAAAHAGWHLSGAVYEHAPIAHDLIYGGCMNRPALSLKIYRTAAEKVCPAVKYSYLNLHGVSYSVCQPLHR